MIAVLVRHLLVSTVFAAIVAIFPSLMRKRGAAARHVVWLIAAAKFALPAALFSFAGMGLGRLFPSRPTALGMPFGLSAVVPLSVPAALSPQSSGAFPLLILVVWVCGAIVMAAVWLRRLRAPTGPFVAPLQQESKLLVRLARRVKVRGRIALRASEAKIEPAVSGLWRHTITVPECLSKELEEREFEAVLLHELAHVKRRDNLTAGFVHLLTCLFWFHPLLWWIERRLIAEQERACDEMALRCGATPEEYASGILKVCRFHLTSAAAGVCGITGSSLNDRLEAITSYKPSHLMERVPRLLAGALVSAMVVVPLVFGFLMGPQSYARAGEEQGHAPAATSKNSVICSFAGKSYPMGSVISIGNGPIQQMCVQDAQGHPMFVLTNDAARRRSLKVIALPTPPPVVCQPAPSGSGKYCGCRTNAGLSLFSPGAIVGSAKGPLRCRAEGGTWRAAIPADFGGGRMPPPPPKQ